MFADNCAATNGMHTDFLAVTLHAACVTIVYIMILIVQGVVNGIGNHNCCAAGSIDLLIVMLLYNLNVKLSAQNSGSFLC